MRLQVGLRMRIGEGLHVGFLEDEVMLGVEFEVNQDIRVEGHLLDPLDQAEQGLVLGILPDDVAGFLHHSEFKA